MSSYFDDKAREVADLWETCGVEDFLVELAKIEKEVYEDVSLICGDREFPDGLRQKAMGIMAVTGVYQPVDLPTPEEALDWAMALGCSRMIEDLHSFFHEVAGRGLWTRFGRLSDNPRADRERRDDEDGGS